MSNKAIVIGCGITGAVIARELADRGFSVEIVEKRNHIGGNMYDRVDEHGCLVSMYGPHAFHTNSNEVFNYIGKYEEWIPYKLKCSASWNGKTVPTPFNFKAIDAYYSKSEAERLKTEFRRIFPNGDEITVVDALNSNNKDLQNYAQYLFDNDYAPYTAKQWRIKPEDIDESVLKRVPLRMSYEEGYFRDKYQVYPKHSYTRFFENLLNSPNIKIRLSADAQDLIKIKDGRVFYNEHAVDYPVVYTGAVDKLFGYCLGELPYRSLRFEWKYEKVKSFQQDAVVAYPQEAGYTRITEYTKIPEQEISGTVYAVEYPVEYKKDTGNDAYYPVLTEQSIECYNNYRIIASKIRHLYCCGRLGCFKYYNMDEAITSALMTARQILETT